MLRWANGDRQLVELHASNLRSDGHPRETLYATNGRERERLFWLDLEKYRAGQVVFVEVP